MSSSQDVEEGHTRQYPLLEDSVSDNEQLLVRAAVSSPRQPQHAVRLGVSVLLAFGAALAVHATWGHLTTSATSVAEARMPKLEDSMSAAMIPPDAAAPVAATAPGTVPGFPAAPQGAVPAPVGFAGAAPGVAPGVAPGTPGGLPGVAPVAPEQPATAGFPGAQPGVAPVPPAAGVPGVPPAAGAPGVPPAAGAPGVPPAAGAPGVPPGVGVPPGGGVPPGVAPVPAGAAPVPPAAGSPGVPPGAVPPAAVPPPGGLPGVPAGGAKAPPPAAPASKRPDGMRDCSDDEVLKCPADWLSGPTGGFFCKKNGGCSAWTKEGGEFPKDQCPDQCAIGQTPPHAPTTPPPTAAAPADAAKNPPADAAKNTDDGQKKADDGKEDLTGGISPCNDDEAACPDEWKTAKHGGYFCRTTKGCSPWTKEGGSFPDSVCPDQCSVGFTPMTITSTSTTTITSTSTVTTTYPGMGIKLLCWSLAQPGYEYDILRRQQELHAGIFACDVPLIMSFTKSTIGAGKEKIDTTVVEQLQSGTSKDGTSANTAQFMKAWEVIRVDGRYQKNDWIIKVDPDAVLLPDRLRIHLNPHQGANAYLRNCDKPMSEGTMMFGALEAISKPALDGYYANFDACNNEVPWQEWGEDLFMMRCLEHVGTQPAEDFALIQDGVCKGVWCGDDYAAAFHPMKNVPAWEACWKEAIAAR